MGEKVRTLINTITVYLFGEMCLSTANDVDKQTNASKSISSLCEKCIPLNTSDICKKVFTSFYGEGTSMQETNRSIYRFLIFKNVL